MKLAPLALGLACAVPAFADVAVPQPAPKATWDTRCAARLDAAAVKAGLPRGATSYVLPLRREDGRANPVRYAEYATAELLVSVGEEAQPRPDTLRWEEPDPLKGMRRVAFRRLHNRFAKIEGEGALRLFREAAEDCLKMGEAK